MSRTRCIFVDPLAEQAVLERLAAYDCWLSTKHLDNHLNELGLWTEYRYTGRDGTQTVNRWVGTWENAKLLVVLKPLIQGGFIVEGEIVSHMSGRTWRITERGHWKIDPDTWWTRRGPGQQQDPVLTVLDAAA